MKKILSLGAAAAVLAMTAVGANAAVKPQFATSSVKAGDTVTVNFVVEDTELSEVAFVVNAENMTYVADSNNSENAKGLAAFGQDTMKFALIGMGGTANAVGTTILSLQFTVNDDVTGEIVPTVSITAAEEKYADAVNDVAVTVEVLADTPEVPDAPGAEDPGTEGPSVEDPTGGEGTGSEGTGSEGTGSEGTGSEGTGSEDTTNPDTGIALAVVPAVMAGAAIVVAKKRK